MSTNFYKSSIFFWFILLILALINATIRETTYKPLLVPYIGIWAHQISSLTGIILFFLAIYFFLKKTKNKYTQKDLINVGLLWILMTIIFECFMNIFIRHLSFQQVLQTYYFWTGDTWFFVLLSLLISPLIVHRILHKKS
ncbi:MAG: hypothetical protein KIH89_001685 [Candidatus Shapirobacteria bacterium]|nr:hypothetical protein [Candidatus Shapirobacteria bacterium]